jgi:hypothetical protein
MQTVQSSTDVGTESSHGPARGSEQAPLWTAFDPDSNHLWNRLHAALYAREAPGGAVFGFDAIDPYLWFRSQHLRTESRARQQAISVLDEFTAGGYDLIRNPLARALMQRDLWSAFDGATAGGASLLLPDAALERRLVEAIGSLALSREEFRALPDMLSRSASDLSLIAAAEIASLISGSPTDGEGQGGIDVPSSLCDPESGWVCIGRGSIPGAYSHVEAAPFFARSVFFVLLRSPDGRMLTQKDLQAIEAGDDDTLLPGTQVALVRQALLIDDQYQIVASPLVESVQLRRFGQDLRQDVSEYVLDRSSLLSGGNGLTPVSSDDTIFPLFRAHPGDAILAGSEGVAPLAQCAGCHVDRGLGISGARSILSLSRERFPLPEGTNEAPRPTSWAHEASLVIETKQQHASWALLQSLR